MRLEDAEDLWLACVCQAPAYADHSLVTPDHLTPRARTILDDIKRVVADGWPMVTSDQLSAGPLRTIPRRMETIDAPSTIAAAERELIKAWAKERYYYALRSASEVCREHGIEAARTELAEEEEKLQAQTAGIHWRTAGESARSYVQRVRQRTTGDSGTLLGSGFPAIDKALRHWPPKGVTTLGGWTNEGKSTLGLQLLTGLAVNRTPTALISLEDPTEIASARQFAMLVKEIEAVVRMDSDESTPADLALLEAVARDVLDALPMEMTYGAGWSVEQVCYAVQDAARRGARVVGVDYLQCFETLKGEDRRVVLGNAARKIKAASVHVGVHLLLYSQLVRPEGRAARKCRPSMYMFKETGDVENMTDNAMLVWRPEKDKDLTIERAVVLLDKLKEGKAGTVDLGFDTERHMFTLESPSEARTGQREIGDGGWPNGSDEYD